MPRNTETEGLYHEATVMTSAQRFMMYVYPMHVFCHTDYDTDIEKLSGPERIVREEELYELFCCRARAKWLADHRRLRNQVETLQKRISELLDET